MSEELYNRAMIREQSIWPSFLYNLPEAESTKAIIFGLYANAYLLGHNYLRDIEAEELQRLVDVYDSNMSELDMHNQNLVLEIASKKYIKAIEIQIKNNILNTKTQQLNAAEREYDAKLEALDVDQKALETKRAQIELARDRAELKNKDLTARITLEELAQNYVAVEISKKELEVSRENLKQLTAGLRGIEIQIEITNVACQITELEASKSGYIADNATMETQIATIEASKNEYTANIVEINTQVAITEASKIEYDADIAEADIAIAKLELLKSDIAVQIRTLNLEKKEIILSQAKYGTEIAEIEINIAEIDTSIVKYENEEKIIGIDISMIEASKSQYDADIEQYNARTAMTDLVSARLTIAEAETIIAEKEITLSYDRLSMVRSREKAIAAEQAGVEVLTASEAALAITQVEEIAIKHALVLQKYKDSLMLSAEKVNLANIKNVFDSDLSVIDMTSVIENGTLRATVPLARQTAKSQVATAIINAAETLAKADILTTLTHEIGSA